MQDNRTPMNSEDEIDLLVIAKMLWRYKYLIVIASLICGLVAVVLALTAVPVYRAETVIAEAHDGDMSAAASLANQFGGLASLAGVNLGANNKGRETQALLKSRRLVEEFIVRYQLLPTLFPEQKKKPTLWRAVERFKTSMLSIREDKRSGVTIVAVNWSDPVTAARWANDFVSLANERIRVRALDEAKRNISYLNEQIARTDMVGVQRVMYNLIENETKTLMLANARVEYAFTVIDPAVPPEQRISPKRTLMVLFGGALGLFIGIVAAFVLNALHRRKHAAASGPI